LSLRTLHQKQRRIRIHPATAQATCHQGKPDQIPQGWINPWWFHLTPILNGPTNGPRQAWGGCATPAGLGIQCSSEANLCPNAGALSSHEDWESCARCPTHGEQIFADARRAYPGMHGAPTPASPASVYEKKPANQAGQ